MPERAASSTRTPPRRPSAPIVRPDVPGIVRAGDLHVDDLARRVRDHDLIRVVRGIYAEPPPDGPPWRNRQYMLLARAAALHRRMTGGHWFSHTTAAVLWGLDLGEVPSTVHATTLVNPHVRRDRWDGTEVQMHWTSRRELAAEVTGLLPMPASSLERTAFDCAATIPPGRALAVVDSALRAGADPEVLAGMVDAAAGRRGVRRARAVVERADGRSDSAGESLVRWMLLEAGLPVPDLQLAIETRLGWRWVDLGWTEERVAVEFDGRQKYGSTQQEAVRSVFEEKRRQDAIEDEGWTVARVTWADLRDPSAVTGRIGRALRRSRNRRVWTTPR